jgi:hypothetical protein
VKFSKTLLKVSDRPIGGKNSPNLVTLIGDMM